LIRTASLEELSSDPASRVHNPAFMSVDFPIRLAGPDDAPEVARLLHVDDVSGLSLAVLGKHYLLVVDAPDGGLAAAAVVRLEAPRADIRVLAVAKPYEGRGLEDRIIELVEGMSHAFGCTRLNVPSRAA
jgi:GNAT superfamily N-acetyltransferase